MPCSPTHFGRVVACAVLTVFAPNGSPASEPEVVSTKRIWNQGKHNAFTDLIRVGDVWYCVFREADAHVGPDGRIRVLRSADGETWESAALVAERGVDLRDPKLSVMPDGKLMIS